MFLELHFLHAGDLPLRQDLAILAVPYRDAVAPQLAKCTSREYFPSSGILLGEPFRIKRFPSSLFQAAPWAVQLTNLLETRGSTTVPQR